jgi:hypothetical protein
MANFADLHTAVLRVSQSRRHITRQEQIVRELRAHGHPSEAAEELLTIYLDTLALHTERWNAIKADLGLD